MRQDHFGLPALMKSLKCLVTTASIRRLKVAVRVVLSLSLVSGAMSCGRPPDDRAAWEGTAREGTARYRGSMDTSELRFLSGSLPGKEKLLAGVAETRPALIIGDGFDTDKLLEFDDTEMSKLNKLTTVVPIKFLAPFNDAVAKYRRLAESLGLDVRG